METHMVHLIWTTALTQLLHLSIFSFFYLSPFLPPPAHTITHTHTRTQSRCRNVYQVWASAGCPLINRSDGEQRSAAIESPRLVHNRPLSSSFLITGDSKGVHVTRTARWNSFACLGCGSGACEGYPLLSGLVVWSLAPSAHISTCHSVRKVGGWRRSVCWTREAPYKRIHHF